MEGCFLGNIMVWKLIKFIFSVVKYVKDCFVLYMFCSGDSFYLLDVFDKLKYGMFEFFKILLIEFYLVV